ncbi:hypothetical protein D3C76_1717660 [compost metagenome]
MMSVDDILDDRKTQSRSAALAPNTSFIGFIEAIKDKTQIIARDADPRIRHGRVQLLALPARLHVSRHRNGSSFRRMPESIVQQVGQNLL